MLQFGEVVFLGFWVDVFDFRRLCPGVTHPQPLSRGEVEVLLFLLWMSEVERWCLLAFGGCEIQVYIKFKLSYIGNP